MVLNLEILQQFIDRNSTQKEDHKIWNQSIQNALTMTSFYQKVGLSKNNYQPYELFWIIENRKEMVPNTKLERACQINNCVSHYNAIQYNLESIVEMDVHTYIKVCERFDNLCETNSETNSETNCVNWKGSVDMNGYGQFRFLGKSKDAHCVSYILANCEDIPKGLVVRHLCPTKNRLCVNPDHLTVGTAQQNSQDEIDGGHTRKGEKNHNTTISKQVAQSIIDSFGNKKTIKERAAEFGVSKTIVQSIDTARVWRHLMTLEQISERESVERLKRNNEVVSDDIIQKVKNSKESLRKCGKTHNITTSIVQKIRNGKYKSSLERDEIGFKEAIERLVKYSTNFHDPVTGIEHLLFKNDISQDSNAKRYRIFYFGRCFNVHQASYMAHRKIKSIEQGKVVRHRCVYKHCVSYECLELGTMQDNANDKQRDNTTNKGELHPNAKITQKLANQIKETKGIGTQQQRSEFFKVSIKNISNIDCNRTWTHLEDNEIDQKVIDNLEEYVASQPTQPKIKRARLL
jgi:hypothetical protein